MVRGRGEMRLATAKHRSEAAKFKALAHFHGEIRGKISPRQKAKRPYLYGLVVAKMYCFEPKSELFLLLAWRRVLIKQFPGDQRLAVNTSPRPT